MLLSCKLRHMQMVMKSSFGAREMGGGGGGNSLKEINFWVCVLRNLL